MGGGGVDMGARIEEKVVPLLPHPKGTESKDFLLQVNLSSAPSI